MTSSMSVTFFPFGGGNRHLSGILPLVFSFDAVLLSFLGSLLLGSLYSLFEVTLSCVVV